MKKYKIKKSGVHLFEIVGIDDYGRRSGQRLGFFYGKDKREAEKRAAFTLKNPDIYNTGFYEAKKVDHSELKEEIKDAESTLNYLKGAYRR